MAAGWPFRSSLRRLSAPSNRGSGSRLSVIIYSGLICCAGQLVAIGRLRMFSGVQ